MSKVGAPLVAVTDGTVTVVGIGNGCEDQRSKQLYWIPSLKLWETLYSENENQMDGHYVGASSAVTEELHPLWLERGQAQIIASDHGQTVLDDDPLPSINELFDDDLLQSINELFDDDTLVSQEPAQKKRRTSMRR